HPDGARVASAGWDGTVRVWDATTGRQQALLDHGDHKIVTAVAVHPDGRYLASRSRGAVFLWDLATGKAVHRWDTPTGSWRDTRLAFSPDGRLLASGAPGGVALLWDVATRAEVARLQGHRGDVRDVAFSPDGRWLASAAEGEERVVRIWDV